jgi:hypothetical protein
MTFTWFIGYIEIIARPFFISDPLSAIGPYNDEHCVILQANDGYDWHDADCDRMNQFICEEEETTTVNIIG